MVPLHQAFYILWPDSTAGIVRASDYRSVYIYIEFQCMEYWILATVTSRTRSKLCHARACMSVACRLCRTIPSQTNPSQTIANNKNVNDGKGEICMAHTRNKYTLNVRHFTSYMIEFCVGVWHTYHIVVLLRITTLAVIRKHIHRQTM